MSTSRRVTWALAVSGVAGLSVAAACAHRTRRDAPPSGTLAIGDVPGDTTAPTPTPAPAPAEGKTTIAPFPVPGDASPEATLRWKTLNLPKFGDFVYVSELPEAVERVAPEYPKLARDRGVQGIVMIQALVLPDGSVAETWVIHSIPELDTAAARAVQKWRFKPAKTAEGPTAVWIAVPVKFSLH